MIRSILLAAALIGAVTMTACGKAATTPPAESTMAAMPGMPGMSGDPMPAGDGTRSSWTGYTLVPVTTTLPANAATTFAFRITGPDTKPVTLFQPDQTKLMHLYLIRTDLTGYQHVHPSMAADGTWTVNLAALSPGSYRAYTTFVTPDPMGKPIAFALSVPLTVPGPATDAPLPAPSSTSTVDGYVVRLSGKAPAMALHITRNGRPVTDLQPYLGTDAHLSAFHAGDLAFAHLHPSGPGLTFNAEFSAPGTWRVYVQFQTNGQLHTAAFTVPIR